MARHDHLGGRLLRFLDRRTAFGDHGHARDGSGGPTWYGAPGYFVLGAMHAVLFWVSISFLSPLVLLVGLFNGRRRLLHDVILGTVVVNSSVRTHVHRPRAATEPQLN